MSDLNSPHPPTAGEGAPIPETLAKQGRRGTHTFVILVVSTVLAIVVMFGIWTLRAGTNRNGASAGETKSSAGRMFNQGPAASSERSKAPS